MHAHRIIGLVLMLMVGLLLGGVPAMADPVSIQFVGLGGQNQNGVYTYPYYLTINNGPWTPMICDDFSDHSGVGDAWQANITDLSSHNVSGTMFGDLTKYEEAAYLLLHINNNNSDQWGNINWAIWTIFDPGIDPGPGNQDGVNYWLNLAEAADLSNVDFSGVEIVTPTTPGYQEFMYVTPEPGTLLMIGGGLLAFWARCRQRV